MKKIILILLLLLGGAAIFVFGSPYYSVFPTNGNQLFNTLLVLFFLILSLALKRSQSWNHYWPAVYALFIAAAAMLFLNTGWLNLHQESMPPAQYLALDKLSQFLHVVPVIIGLTLLAGDNLGCIFIQRGALRRGLTFGIVSFILFALLAFFLQAGSTELRSMMPQAIPWIFLFIFANSIMEELWFRAIFLRKYQVLVGGRAAILVTALIFGASHINATYAFPGGGLVFGLVVFGLGLAGAYAMLKDDSLLGPVLFHAGYDLIVIGSILEAV